MLRVKRKSSPAPTDSKMSVTKMVSVKHQDIAKPVQGVKLSSEIMMAPEMKVSVVEVLLNYTTSFASFGKNQDCCICCEKLEASSNSNEDEVVILNKCKHLFHKSCIIAMYSSGIQDGSLQCPVCKAIYGIKTGNQPSGIMNYYVVPYSLPSYETCDTICIEYHISSGIQDDRHPHPKKPYTCRGFPRRCYLPDNEDGKKILNLLVVAWERRLIFTIGTSATTGENSTVTWNEIHHKTEFSSNITGHGYPDPSYFDNVLLELSLQGVLPLSDADED